MKLSNSQLTRRGPFAILLLLGFLSFQTARAESETANSTNEILPQVIQNASIGSTLMNSGPNSTGSYAELASDASITFFDSALISEYTGHPSWGWKVRDTDGKIAWFPPGQRFIPRTLQLSSSIVYPDGTVSIRNFKPITE